MAAMTVATPDAPLSYSASELDRAAHRRKDAAWLAASRHDPASRLVTLSSLQIPVTGPEEAPSLLAPSVAELGAPIPEPAIFLGQQGGIAWWALDLDADVPPASRLVELRTVSQLLPAAEAATLACARGLVHWHRGHRFCGTCGSPTATVEAGHARRCATCAREHFPRTDPAVIVLVTDGEQCLLGRSPRFPPGMYSTLAGFVEPGESLEDTLRREVREETGIELAAVRYRASQPWPFPQSLMLGFRARAASTAIRIDPEELEDARWFRRAELGDPARRPVRLPAQDSITRFLIDEWLAEG